jgi:DNA modification methylase
MRAPYYQDERATLHKADALAVLADLPTASVDALITDPPYSSGGMVRGDRAGSDTKSKYSGSYGKQPDTQTSRATTATNADTPTGARSGSANACESSSPVASR